MILADSLHESSCIFATDNWRVLGVFKLKIKKQPRDCEVVF